jgi:hypothetical protein
VTQTATHPKHVPVTDARSLAALARAGLPSRANPPDYRVSTPALLRYTQVALLVVGLLLGLSSIPLILAGNHFSQQRTVEQEHANLSAIQSEVARANEIALTSLLQGKPDRPGFQQQMGTVAEKVAAAGTSGSVDTSLLGAVNAGLVQYTAEVNAALTAEEAKAGSGRAEITAAQTTLGTDVLTNLDTLLANASAADVSPVWAIALAWTAIAVGAVCAVWIMVLVARRSRRVLNLGLLGSLAVLAVAGVAVGMLGGLVTGQTNARIAHNLTTAQGDLARARSAELTYILVPSDQGKAQVDTYIERAETLAGETLSDASPEGIASSYRSSWDSIAAYVSAGKNETAVNAAMKVSGPALDAANRTLGTHVTDDRQSVLATLTDGAPVLNGLGIGMMGIGLGYIILGFTGVHARLREYR